MALVLIQLSLLFLSYFTVFGDDVEIMSWAQPPYHHHHGPAESPMSHTFPHPHHPINHRPSPAPSHPHPFPKRSLIAVQGVVYCKSCKYPGVPTLLGAAPLLGAVVKLECHNTKYPIVTETKTDKNGYFFILAPKMISTYGHHKCKVFLVSSPLPTCNKPTNLFHGEEGATLIPKRLPVPFPLPYELFAVGPFAFEPSFTCPH